MILDGYRFHLTCPCCAGLVQPQAEGVTTGKETRAISTCTECGAQVLLEVRVSVLGKSRGNWAGAQQRRERQKANA